MEIILFIITIVLFLNLRGRVNKLEQSITNTTVQRAPEPSYPPQPQQADNQPITVPNSILPPTQVAQPIVAPTQTGPTSFDRFVDWVREDWLLKLGVLLLLIGFGWLTTYAFLNNWIGPMGRIALGIVAGALFLLLGGWRIRKYIHQGGIFLVLGSTTILLTIFAARTIYNFFTPLSALAVMFLSMAFVALASVKYNSRSLALSSLILAGVAPLLTNAPSPDYVGLFAYLFVVVLGAVWIVVLTGRRELTTAALVLITLYSLPHLFSSVGADRGVLLLFAYAFSAVFFLTNTAGILKSKNKDIVPDLTTAAGNGLFLLAWIMIAAQDEWKSLIIAAWMIVFTVGAFLIFKITKKREPFYVYAGVGIALLAAATSAELSGATLIIAYTIESALCAIVAYLILRDSAIAERVTLLLAVPMTLSAQSMTSSAWATSVINKDFFVLLILAVTLVGLGLLFFFTRRSQEGGVAKSQQLNAILLIAGSFYAYLLLWLSLHAGLQNDSTAVMISLVVYTIVGVLFYFYGLAHGNKGLQLYGGVLVGFVVGRLLLIEVWRMEMAGRIVTFFLVGALLISTAFLGKKKRAQQ